MPSIPETVKANLVRSVIDHLRTDQSSFVFEQDVKAIRYVPNKSNASGKWTAADNEALAIVVVGEVGPDSLLGPYGTLQLTEEKFKDISKKKALQMKGRIHLRMPPSFLLDFADGDTYTDALQNIASNLNAMQCEREESGEVDVPDPDNEIIVYSFVNRSDEGNFVDVNLATDCVFVADKNVSTKDLFDNKKEGNGSADDTLATWPDPAARFSSVAGKRSIRVNKEFQAFDHNGNWVHPLRWATVFTSGTAIEAHVMPLLWDMSKKSPKSGDRLTRTYQLKIIQIRALHPPHADDDDDKPSTPSSSRPAKRAAEAEPELAPPKKRAFANVDLAAFTQGSSSSIAGSSSATLSPSPPGDTQPSSPATGSTSSSSVISEAPAVAHPTGKRDKGKGKAKAKDQDVHMG